MERLTYWNEDLGCYSYHCASGDVTKRLAIIENILCEGGEDYDLDRLSIILSQRMTMRQEVSERYRLTGKIKIERLKEIVEAEHEGRCVLLSEPMKPLVYYPNETDVFCPNKPELDVVKVVRCKDCKWWEKGKDYTPYCNHPISGLFTAEKTNNFCSYGERKEK